MKKSKLAIGNRVGMLQVGANRMSKRLLCAREGSEMGPIEDAEGAKM